MNQDLKDFENLTSEQGDYPQKLTEIRNLFNLEMTRYDEVSFLSKKQSFYIFLNINDLQAFNVGKKIIFTKNRFIVILLVSTY